MSLDTPRQLDTPDFRFLADVAARLATGPIHDDRTLEAVSWLARVADPRRADRLRPRPGEPGVLVERLTAHLLRRVSPDAVAEAQRLLDQPGELAPAVLDAAPTPAAAG